MSIIKLSYELLYSRLFYGFGPLKNELTLLANNILICESFKDLKFKLTSDRLKTRISRRIPSHNH